MSNNVEIRYGREFGMGDVWSPIKLPEFDLSKMSRDDRLLAVGYSHACPDVLNIAKEYTYDWTIKRYLECNWIFQNEVLVKAKKFNPKLYEVLTNSVPRLPGELPDLHINKQLVPPSFEIEMAPLSTTWGYAIPRLILVGARDKKNIGSKEKVKEVKEIVNKLISKYTNPIKFTVNLANEVFNLGADPLKIFDHLLSTNVLREEGCKTMYRQTFAALERFAPDLFYMYENALKEKGKEGLHKLGIITPSDLK